MNRSRKFFLCLAIFVLVGVVLLLVIDHLAPRFISLDSTKTKIQSMVSERTGGTIDYERIVPSIFPRPGIELSKVNLSIPGTAEVSAETVRLYLKVLPLLLGKVSVSRLLVLGPELDVNVSNLTESKEGSETIPFFSYIQKSIAVIIAPLSVSSYDLDIEIREGRIGISSDKGADFLFTDVNTYLTSSGKALNVHVSCISNFSDTISLTGKINPETLNVQGRVSLHGFKPEILIKQISTSAQAILTATEADLSFTFVLFGPKLIIANLAGKVGRSTFTGINAELDLAEDEPYLYITSASLQGSLAQIFQVLISSGTLGSLSEKINSIDGTMAVTSAKVDGPLFTPSSWDFLLRGDALDVTVDEKQLPGPFHVSRGTFEVTPENLIFNDLQVTALDSSLKVSGIITDYTTSKRTAKMSMQGDIGTETEGWINESAKIPPSFRVDSPLIIKHADLGLNSDPAISIDAEFSVHDGPDLSLKLDHSPSMIAIKRLLIKDDVSDTDITLLLGGKELHMKFKGNLDSKTVSSLFPSIQKNGWARGDFEVQLPRDQPMGFIARGELDAGDVIFPRDTGDPFIINTVSLLAENNVISVNQSELGLGSKQFTAEGKITSSGGDFLIDLYMDIGRLSWEDIERNFLSKKETEKVEKRDEGNRTPHIRGTVDISAGSFEYKRFLWEPVRVVVALEPRDVRVGVLEAVICNVSTPGNVVVKDGQVQLYFQGEAKKEKLKNSLKCLLGEDVNLTGIFDFKGHVRAHGKPKELKRSLNGKVKFKSRDGTIYSYPLFSRIFSIVNVLEVFKGRYDDIVSKGFPYDSIEIKGDIHRGKLKLSEASMDGSTMKMAGEGEVDLKDKDADLILIVSPLRTIDSIIEQIPVIRDITAGTLISIAMKVSGKIDDPKIVTLPPSAVGEGIVGMVKRIFKLPLQLFEPQSTDSERK